MAESYFHLPLYTLMVAAVQEAFSFVGIERDPEYVETARARLAHVLQYQDLQNRLFAEAGLAPIAPEP